MKKTLDAAIDELVRFMDPTPLTREFITSRFTLRPGSDNYWELAGDQLAVCCAPEFTHELGEPHWDVMPLKHPRARCTLLPIWLNPTTIGQLRWLLWRLDIPFPETQKP